MQIITGSSLLSLTANIVSAYAGHNVVPTDGLSDLIKVVYGELVDLHGKAATDEHNHKFEGEPATQSVMTYVEQDRTNPYPGVADEYLVCLEDGLTMKMLKRHLLTVHGLTPDQYRAKRGLPSDYPMTAPNYAKLRSTLAKESGLGLRPEARSKRRRA